MKYQITLDNKENKNSPYILYDLRNAELVLENPELDLTISKVGKLSFSIYSDHPYFDKLEKKSSKISVYKDNRTIFRGRIVEDEQGLYNNKSVLCESALAYLNDSIVRPSSFSGSPLDFLIMIINNHNLQVSDEQKLLLGNVTVEDPNNYISRSWEDYLSSWEVLEKRGIELVGGYLVERYEDDGTYIDWLEDFDDTSTQVIEFGENIIDIFARNNANNTYSVAIPLGVETENEDGTKTRLTIESVNNGLDYIVNQDALNKYGWIVAPVSETTWDDVTLASNLKTKCENWLNNQGVMIESEFEITALDLQATDKNIESFFIYEYVRIKSKPHNIDKILLLSSIKIPLAHPENTQITVGESVNTLTGIELGNKQNIDNVIERVGIVEKNYTINNEKLNDIEKAIEYFSVDLAQYNITIATDTNKIPLESKNYDINFYAYFKGEVVKPTISISGAYEGITTSKTDTSIRFSTSNSTAIANLVNGYTIKFTYSVDSITYTVNKKVDIVLALKGSDGTSVNILGSYNTLEELKAAHPTGNIGDAYIVQGNMYVWCIEDNDWQNVGNIQGPTGADGTSSYLHIRYSDDGTTFTANEGKDVGRYRGELVSTNPVASTVFNDYTWYDMAIAVEDELNSIREELQTNITSIEQNQDEILMTALQDYVAKSEFTTYQETVATEFIQTAEDFNFQFNNITSQITTIDGETQQQFQEISKYIRFVDGTIVLGESGNELTLVQQNDRISFIQNNSEVAYFSNNELTVTDAKFLNSLRVGDFAYIPRANGSLDFKKVVV